jgi:protein required for attachment to host cells
MELTAMNTEPRLQRDMWVLVCDGRKALFLQNAGDHAYPKLETREVMEHPVERSSAMGSDAPGRTHSSVGSGSSAVDQGDPHDHAEREFLRNVAGRLDTLVSEKRIHHLIVAAPARALGMLRPYLSTSVQHVVSAEVAHDYVKSPLHEIERHLTAN